MSDLKEERRDNLLGGLAIILIGILLSSSSVWGLINNSYLVTNGFALVIFLILGIGSIIFGGALIFFSLINPEA